MNWILLAILGGVLGGVLESAGADIATWQYWAAVGCAVAMCIVGMRIGYDD